MSHAEIVSRRLWSDWFFERVPLPPALFGALLSALLIGVLVSLAAAMGSFERLAAEGTAWWQDRDGRVSVLLSLLAGAIPAALRYHELGTRRNLEALAATNLWRGAPPAALRNATAGSPRAALWFGLFGYALVPIVAFSVDRDIVRYFTASHWDLGVTWTWVVGFLVTFTGGVLTYRAFADSRKFARLAHSLPAVDLLERDALLPFARQGLRSAVPGVLFLTFLAANLGDAGFVLATGLLGCAVLVQNAIMLVIPMRGVHERLRAAKRAELARVNAAIRGEPGALRGSPLAPRSEPSLADLLAWRAFVEEAPEWPIDLPTLGRFAAYVGVPLLGWLGAGLVQHALEAALS